MSRALVPTILCKIDDVPDGGARGFDPFDSGRDTVLVVRRNDRLFAWQDSCPHIDGSPLAWRKNAYLNAAGDRIVCSGHGALFDIVTGQCTLGPCLGQSLRPVPLDVDAQGWVSLHVAAEHAA